MTTAVLPAHQGQRRRRAWIRIAGSVLALAALLLFLPRDAIWQGLRSVPPAAWPLAVALYLGCHVIGVIKWRLLVNAGGAGLRFRDAVHAYYWGLFANMFLPSIVGGDVVRAGVAFRRVRSRTGLVLGSIIDRIQDVVALGIVAATGALLSPRALDPRSRGVFVTLGVVLLVMSVVALAVTRFVPVRRIPFKFRRHLARVRRAFRSVASRPQAMATALLLGVTLQSLLVLMNWWLGGKVGLHAPLYVWLFVWPLAKLSGLLPVTQGGIGVREAAQAALFAPFGVSAAAAVAAGLAFEVVLLSGGLVSGAVALLAGARTGRASQIDSPEAGSATLRGTVQHHRT